MKQTKILFYLLLALLLVIASCQKDEITEEIDTTESIDFKSAMQKSSSACETRTICYNEPVLTGYELIGYTFSDDCPDRRPPRDLEEPLENAKVISYGLTPRIVRGGYGCADNNCIWMIATKVGKNVGVTTRHPVTWAPLESYTKNPSDPNNKLTVVFRDGKWTCTLRLATQKEKDLFASQGLLCTIYNLNDGCGKWSTKLIKGRKPPVEPPCNPHCP
ncbi:hypothetical protein IWQ47_000697 [Aquimarina sp. EL_43]|uniref:hypothetical protein n=1 Tax=unclassified Aquimarina TaxID=2627091 RepID=UPI0018CB5465|nr:MULTISPECIES: hypothetical protein [unclassified Aquimarina]MBG6128613.1 hypothetical protein [Aquimarina sp. EL_35]MBG6149676.1 hypothetical protein [Aquimarina sp. EL_32]MBG6167639.1 hypothetical protein [Aquimarina sp. EL_43]